MSEPLETSVTLVTRRLIRASPQWLFAVWTEPDHLRRWWGPKDVTCPAAEVDLRVGGAFRIANLFPDGTLVWITGWFEAIEPPHRLVYTWRLESSATPPERVTVCFEPRAQSTEVVVVHERIADAPTRDQHAAGWHGCLDGLQDYAASIQTHDPGHAPAPPAK